MTRPRCTIWQRARTSTTGILRAGRPPLFTRPRTSLTRSARALPRRRRRQGPREAHRPPLFMRPTWGTARRGALLDAGADKGPPLAAQGRPIQLYAGGPEGAPRCRAHAARRRRRQGPREAHSATPLMVAAQKGHAASCARCWRRRRQGPREEQGPLRRASRPGGTTRSCARCWTPSADKDLAMHTAPPRCSSRPRRARRGRARAAAGRRRRQEPRDERRATAYIAPRRDDVAARAAARRRRRQAPRDEHRLHRYTSRPRRGTTRPRALLDAGADDLARHDGATPLMVAAQKGTPRSCARYRRRRRQDRAAPDSRR